MHEPQELISITVWVIAPRSLGQYRRAQKTLPRPGTDNDHVRVDFEQRLQVLRTEGVDASGPPLRQHPARRHCDSDRVVAAIDQHPILGRRPRSAASPSPSIWANSMAPTLALGHTEQAGDDRSFPRGRTGHALSARAVGVASTRLQPVSGLRDVVQDRLSIRRANATLVRGAFHALADLALTYLVDIELPPA